MQSQHNHKIQRLNKSIAWVTPFLGRDGKLMYMEPLLNELSKHCAKFTVITSEYAGDTTLSPFKILLSSQVRRIYWEGKDKHLKGFTFIGPSILKSITKSNAEVLFLVEFSLTTMYGIIARAIRRKTKIILVMESRPVINEGAVLGSLKHFIRKTIAKQCDAILTNNQSGRDFLVEELGADPTKVIAKPYLISHASQSSITDNERFCALNKSSTINFLYVGRLIEAKGLHHLIDAIKLVPEKDRNRIKVDIVGDGDYRDYLTEYISRNNLQNNFHFHGIIEYSELSKFYSAAHVFVFPTLRDYRALAPFEALSAGLPIISSIHDGGSYENVAEGENGYICDPQNIESFSDILKDILSNPEKLLPFAKKSTEMAKDYTIDNAVNNMLSAANLALSQP